MKRTSSWINKIMLSGVLILALIIGTLVAALPSIAAVSGSGASGATASKDQTSIAIRSPLANAWLKDDRAVISGTYTNTNQATTKSTFVFTAFEQKSGNSLVKTAISNSAKNKKDWAISPLDSKGKGTWTFKKKLADGKHKIIIEMTEQAAAGNTNSTTSAATSSTDPAEQPVASAGVGKIAVMSAAKAVTGSNTDSSSTVNSLKTATTAATQTTTKALTDTASISFITGDRPYISKEVIVLPNKSELSAEDLTSVPKDAHIKITITDNKTMDQLVQKIQATSTYYPVNVLLGQDQASGKTTITKTVASGTYIYTLEFTPSKPLTLNQTYLVYVDPGITDDSGNRVFAKFFKFTTKSNMDEKDNPHGNYTLNTNMCANCHNTHVGSNDRLDGGKYYKSLNKDPGENYCMACHDGTLNAPAVDKLNDTHQHFNSTALKQPESCTSCHNPHKGWSSDNPNMLKDHYVYTHKSAHPDQGLDNAKVDSLDTTCSSCHDDNEIAGSTSVKYEVLSYKRSTTAVGTIDPTLKTVSDYSLCLRCHNGDTNKKDSKITDIAKYYADAKSGHFFALPSGQSKQSDGSQLNGQLPCAECHETHGSNNIMNLREQLGNVKTAASDQFKTTGATWTTSDERNFCLKCHNNSTEIYGQVGVFQEKDQSGAQITGHQKTDTQACSECHGKGVTDDQKAVSAAHAPMLKP